MATKSNDGPQRLYRSQKNQVIAGVAGGLGEYFNLDPVIFRILFVLTSLTPPFAGIVVYILLALIVPVRGQSEDKSRSDVIQNIHHNAESIVEDLKNKDWQNLNSRDILGLIIVAIGILILLGQLVGNSWGIIWPVIIILAGVYLIARKR